MKAAISYKGFYEAEINIGDEIEVIDYGKAKVTNTWLDSFTPQDEIDWSGKQKWIEVALINTGEILVIDEMEKHYEMPDI